MSELTDRGRELLERLHVVVSRSVWCVASVGRPRPCADALNDRRATCSWAPPSRRADSSDGKSRERSAPAQSHRTDGSRCRGATSPCFQRPSAEARRITKQEVYSRKMEFHLDCGRDVFVEDIGYSDGITPVLAVPESRAPNGTGAG